VDRLGSHSRITSVPPSVTGEVTGARGHVQGAVTPLRLTSPEPQDARKTSLHLRTTLASKTPTKSYRVVEHAVVTSTRFRSNLRAVNATELIVDD
jgi:hypothetical protein